MSLARRPVFPGLTGIAAAAGGVGALTRLGRYYNGPVSDHFDGLRFFDPHGSAPKSFADLLRWQLGKKPVAWPKLDPSPYSDVPPQRVDNLRDWRITYIGHASLLLQVAGLNILLDPVWSERVSPWTFAGPKRVNDPGIAFEALPTIDAVIDANGDPDMVAGGLCLYGANAVDDDLQDLDGLDTQFQLSCVKL